MIVVFDADCLLCNHWVQFLLRHDRKGVFKFAAMRGEVGRELLEREELPIEGLETLLLVDGGRSWRHTAAILRVLHGLGWPWRLAWLAWLVPSPLRDRLYRWVARNRYRLFGRPQVCMRMPPEQAHRFLP